METYGISRASISRILLAEKQKINNETSKLTQKRGRKTPLTGDVLVYILGKLEQNSQLTLEEIKNSVETMFHIETSTTAIERALQKMNITWKNVLLIPSNWNSEEVIKARAIFVMNLAKLFTCHIVYVDETGFNLHTCRSKSRAAKEEFAKLTLVPKQKRLTIIAALDRTGFFHYRLVNSTTDKHGTNAEDFRNFLMDLFLKLPRNSVIILDNCRIHHAENLEVTWTMAKTSFGIDKLFLAPYSPFLNPIEYGFNMLKEAVKKEKFSNRGELVTVVKEKLTNTVTKDAAEGFYRQAARYYQQCGLGLPFMGKPLAPLVSEENEEKEPLLNLEF